MVETRTRPRLPGDWFALPAPHNAPHSGMDLSMRHGPELLALEDVTLTVAVRWLNDETVEYTFSETSGPGGDASTGKAEVAKSTGNTRRF